MMKHITYSCDGCGKALTPGDGSVGVEFKSTYVSGSQVENRMRLELGNFRDVARHYCYDCLKDFSRIWNSIPLDDGSDK